MALESKLVPYEFLYRWNDKGEPQGAHMVYREVIMDGDTVKATVVLNPLPITPDNSKELATVADAVNTGSLTRCTDLEADLKTLTAHCEAVEKERDDAIAVGAQDAALLREANQQMMGKLMAAYQALGSIAEAARSAADPSK